MGLDNQMLIVPKKHSIDNFSFDESPLLKSNGWEYKAKYDLGYWRKCYGFNRFFRRAFDRRKAETPTEFEYGDCPFRITKLELKEFAEEIKNKHSEVYCDTMFGDYDKSYCKNLKKSYLKVVKEGKRAIKKGNCVYLIASW